MRFVSSSRPVMPKSMSTVRPSGCTMRLPPCRSPWKTPYNIAPSMNPTSPACSTASVSTPASCIAATSSQGMPRSRSMTSTRRVTSVGCGRGTISARWPVSASTRATSSMFSASSRKSSSSTIVSANSSTSAGGLASAAIGMRPVSRGASHAIASRSERTSSAICGRCTLTTTCSPVRSRAACTCAIEAAAIGRALELDEDLVERTTELHLDDMPHAVEVLGGDAVAQQLELGDELLGEEPFAAGDDLAELDVGGPEPPEGDPQPPGDPASTGRAALAALDDDPGAERVPDLADHAREPAERRQVAGLEPPRHLRRVPARASGRRRRATASRRGRRSTGRRR